ncbi:MAG: GDSL-type esterase/lipase family protein [Eubacteriales bacterium]|nr:GDSL-type esterase/lipase family protein [Eubacteriales bacterium]
MLDSGKGRRQDGGIRSSFIKKVFFFGDSNTYGYDPAGFMGGRYSREYRWPEIMQQNLGGIWRVTADGMPGRSIPATHYELDYLRSVIQKEMPFDLFAVMLGTNDLLGTLRPDAEKTARDMDNLISFVKELMPERVLTEYDDPDEPALPGILLVAPPAIALTDQSYLQSYVAGDRTYTELYQDEAEKLTGLYRDLAKSRHLFFADASDWELQFAFDGVHLSESGHVLFAAEMMDVLRHIWNGSGHSCDSCAFR